MTDSKIELTKLVRKFDHSELQAQPELCAIHKGVVTRMVAVAAGVQPYTVKQLEDIQTEVTWDALTNFFDHSNGPLTMTKKNFCPVCLHLGPLNPDDITAQPTELGAPFYLHQSMVNIVYSHFPVQYSQ